MPVALYQSFFFSATLPKPIEKLIERFGRDPVHVKVKTRDTSKNVEQDVIRVARGVDKIDVLSELLEKTDEFKKVLILFKTYPLIPGCSWFFN